MKNYQDSDYAANKNAGGIVYRFVNQIVEVTLEDYLRESPSKTVADFAKLKTFSDDDYFTQDRNDYRQTWKNTSIYGLEESDACTVPSPEYYIIEQPEHADRYERRCELAKRAWDKLTIIQQRRYFMYHVEGLSTWQIAEIENVNQSKIVKSLAAAEKKIKKALIGS